MTTGGKDESIRGHLAGYYPSGRARAGQTTTEKQIEGETMTGECSRNKGASGEREFFAILTDKLGIEIKRGDLLRDGAGVPFADAGC